MRREFNLAMDVRGQIEWSEEGFKATRKPHRGGQQNALGVTSRTLLNLSFRLEDAALLPKIIDHNLLIAGVLHATGHHRIRHFANRFLGDMFRRAIPGIPAHGRQQRQRRARYDRFTGHRRRGQWQTN